ncbi:MAG: VirB8/TrbF family protein [Sphingomonadales bacterium]|jgi:type IV secretion system protein VirB8
MTRRPDPTNDAYHRAAQSWADSMADALRGSRRTAWIVALAATLVAVIEAVTIFAMMPLRTVVPYTLLVDRHTGHVELLKPLEPGLIAPDRALTQSFLVQYVLAREGFDRATIRDEYRKVALWSAGAARDHYLAAMARSNPDSPAARLGPQARIAAEVRSVTGLSDGTALVRFETLALDRERPTATRQYWVATVRYRYANAPMAVADRYINPLGFQVLDYRRSPEALPQLLPAAEAADAGR